MEHYLSQSPYPSQGEGRVTTWANGDLGEIEFDFVDVAPAPIFAGFDGAHDGVFGSVEMFCGVFIFGGVAAGDIAADHAHAEVDPSVAHFDAFGADVGFGF
jgi:hypothetical protein